MDLSLCLKGYSLIAFTKSHLSLLLYWVNEVRRAHNLAYQELERLFFFSFLFALVVRRFVRSFLESFGVTLASCTCIAIRT